MTDLFLKILEHLKGGDQKIKYEQKMSLACLSFFSLELFIKIAVKSGTLRSAWEIDRRCGFLCILYALISTQLLTM